MGYNVFQTDLDVLWLGNPYPVLKGLLGEHTLILQVRVVEYAAAICYWNAIADSHSAHSPCAAAAIASFSLRERRSFTHATLRRTTSLRRGFFNGRGVSSPGRLPLRWLTAHDPQRQME